MKAYRANDLIWDPQSVSNFILCVWNINMNVYIIHTKTYHWVNGPLARYVKLQVAHAPGMPGTFSPPAWVNDPDMHHGTCVTHVPWCMPGSLTCGFLWSGAGKNLPGTPGACATPNFTYLARGPCKKDVTPLLMHWSYVFLALTYWYAYACVLSLFGTSWFCPYPSGLFHWHWCNKLKYFSLKKLLLMGID